MKYVFDLESNGLYNEVSTIHCIVLKDIESNSPFVLTVTFITCPVSLSLEQLYF